MRKILIIIITLSLLVVSGALYISSIYGGKIQFVGILENKDGLQILPITLSSKGKVSYGKSLLTVKPQALLGVYVSGGKVFAYIDDFIDPEYKFSSGIYLLLKNKLPNACVPKYVFPYCGKVAYLCASKVYIYDGKQYKLMYTLSPSPVKVEIYDDEVLKKVYSHLNAVYDKDISYLEKVGTSSTTVYRLFYGKSFGDIVRFGLFDIPCIHTATGVAKLTDKYIYLVQIHSMVQNQEALVAFFNRNRWETDSYPVDKLIHMFDNVKGYCAVEKNIPSSWFYIVYPRSLDQSIPNNLQFVRKRPCGNIEVFSKKSHIPYSDALSEYTQSPFLKDFVEDLLFTQEGIFYKVYKLERTKIVWYPGFIIKDGVLMDLPDKKNMVVVQKDGKKRSVKLLYNILYIQPIK